MVQWEVPFLSLMAPLLPSERYLARCFSSGCLVTRSLKSPFGSWFSLGHIAPSVADDCQAHMFIATQKTVAWTSISPLEHHHLPNLSLPFPQAKCNKSIVPVRCRCANDHTESLGHKNTYALFSFAWSNNHLFVIPRCGGAILFCQIPGIVDNKTGSIVWITDPHPHSKPIVPKRTPPKSAQHI